MIILMLRFRPEGLFRERPGLDHAAGPASQRSPDPAVAVASVPVANASPTGADDGGPG
jgi:hypothetical protein